jgi:hypothetical protein
MTGWAKDQGTSGTMIKLLGDPRSEFTNALGMVLDHPGPMAVLGNPRCKRFSMLVDNCIIKSLNVAASDTDPAGGEKPEVSMVDKMLDDLKAQALVARADNTFPGVFRITAAALVGISAGVAALGARAALLHSQGGTLLAGGEEALLSA